MLQVTSPLVSVEWLYQNMQTKSLLIFDATIPKVTSNKQEKFSEEFQIKNAIFFDLKNTFSDQKGTFPNTVLPAKQFEIEAQNIGVNSDSCIVVYDNHGIYSSARVWWLFKTMGFNNVAVLDGGLPAWKQAQFPVEKQTKRQFEKGNFKAIYQPKKVKNFKEVFKEISSTETQIIDARSSGRFYSTEPEPRLEIRSGHIPNSKNLPYSNLLEQGKLKSKEELEVIFKELNPTKKEMIFSCGSGITACVLDLAATIAGYKETSVYDGSWTEWGSLSHLPIEK